MSTLVGPHPTLCNHPSAGIVLESSLDFHETSPEVYT